MGGDWIMLFACLTLFGMYLGQEFVDIQFCGIIRRHRGGSSRLLLAFTMWRYAFVTVMTASWVKLVLYRGSDALSVAFNLVATAFVLDIDNMAYTYLPLYARATVHKFGAMQIAPEELAMLMRTKWLYMLCVPASAPLALYLAVAWGDDFPGMMMVWGIVSFAIASEQFTRSQQSDASRLKFVLEALAKMFGVLASIFMTIAFGEFIGIVSL